MSRLHKRPLSKSQGKVSLTEQEKDATTGLAVCLASAVEVWLGRFPGYECYINDAAIITQTGKKIPLNLTLEHRHQA